MVYEKKIKLCPAMSRIEKGLGIGEACTHSFNRKSFPGSTGYKVGQQSVHGVYSKQCMQDPAIANIYFGRFYKPLS